MEQQFILRLPDSLLEIDPKECSLTRVSQKEVNFTVKGKIYRGIICKIPSVVESQKIVDNKLYKIADISTLVVIYENNEFILEDEIFKHESSGLAPAMAFVKEKRFEKNSVRSEEVEKIETKVNELLSEDLKAIKVEIVANEKESTDIDLDLLAAEIENEFRPSVNEKTVDSVIPMAKPRISTDKGKSIHKNSFEGSKSIDFDIPDIPDIDDALVDKNMENADLELAAELLSLNLVDERESEKNLEDISDPELIALKIKIKEKEEQFEKAANPILKKRFEQALGTLKEEYKAKLDALNKRR